MNFIKNVKYIIKSNMYLYILGDYIVINFLKLYEKEFILLKYYKFSKDSLAIDIGGHKGESIKEISKYYQKIVTFEPNNNHIIAIKNLKKKLFHKIDINYYNLGLGDCETEAKLFIPYLLNYPLTLWASTNKKILEGIGILS